MKYSFKSMNITPTIDFMSLINRSVVIFGASLFGAIALYALEKRNINVTCFCDNNEKKHNTVFCDKPVYSITELTARYSQLPIFIAAKQFDIISNQLREYGQAEMYDCIDLFNNLEIESDCTFSLESSFRIMDIYMNAMLFKRHLDRLRVASLDVVVTEKCSLRCKNCSNLMQFYEKPIDCEINNLFIALKRFMTAVDYLHEIRLLGGEPFIYKKLHDVLNFMQSFNNYGKIIIFTNGTIIPEHVVLQSIKNLNAEVVISNYGALSRNKEKLVNMLTKYNIHHEIFTLEKWVDVKIKHHTRTPEQLKKIYINCCVIDVLTLLHGTLYLCPFAAHAQNLQAIPIPPPTKKDYFDLLDQNISKEDIRENIRKMYLETDYCYACQYCNGRDFNTAYVPIAEQTPSVLEFERFIC